VDQEVAEAALGLASEMQAIRAEVVTKALADSEMLLMMSRLAMATGCPVEQVDVASWCLANGLVERDGDDEYVVTAKSKLRAVPPCQASPARLHLTAIFLKLFMYCGSKHVLPPACENWR